MVVHSALTGSDLHEPKGIAAATVDKVYVSNGAGSGAWQKIESDQIDTASIFNTNKGTMFMRFDDCGATEAIRFVFPFACTVNTITTVLGGALTGANAVLTVTRNGVDAMGTITVTQASSAEGDIDTLSPSSNNTFTDGQWMKIISDGGPSNSATLGVTVEYTRTGA